MKGRFILLMTALMLFAGLPLAKAQAPAGTLLWSESWNNGTANATPSDYLASEDNATVVYGDATIAYASTLDGTKLYNATLAGGTAPELLLAKNDTWTISGIPTSGVSEMTLSFKENNTNGSVSSPTEGITMTLNTSKADTYTYTIENDGNETFDLVFSASGNTRLDDISVSVSGTPASFQLNVATVTNGSISLSHSEATPGTTITVTATPSEGYVLGSLFYNDGNATTDIDISTMQFDMPTSDITVGAVFNEIPATYFQKISTNLTDWSGYYILAYQKDATNLLALTGYTSSYGTVTNIAEHLFADGMIEDNSTTMAMKLTIAQTENGYSIKMGNIGYLGLTSDGNYLNVAETVESNMFEWTINYSNDTLFIGNASYTTRFLQCNTTANPNRFACYKGTQKYPSLYKYNGEIIETKYTISIANGIENGTIEASAETAIEGTNVTITATPDNGYELATLTYVYGENEPIDIKEAMAFNMPAADVTINATFSLIPTIEYSITIANGIENGTIESSAETAVEGTTITVSSSPAEGYMLETLTYVYEGVDPIDIKATKSFEMPAANVTIDATFAELPALEAGDTLWSEPWNNGATGATPEEYLASENHGTVVYGDAELTYTSVSSTTTTKLYNEVLAGGTAPELLVAKNGGSFTASGIPTGGVEEMLLTYKANNTNITLSTTTEGITITARESKAAATYTYVIANNGNATFDLCFNNTASSNTRLDDILLVVKGPDPTYTLTVAEGIVNGSIELSTYEAQEGDEITVTVEPAEGYMLENLTYTYGDVETIFDIDQETLTFEMPAGDVVVNATFKLIPTVEYSITIAEGIENGTIEASAETAVEGTEITVTATPAEGYLLETLTYVYEGAEPIDIKATKSFEMPAADVTINATFAEIPEAYFEHVTEALDDWSGDYLIAYQKDENSLFALTNIIKINTNNVGDTLNIIGYMNNGLIVANDATLAFRVKIEQSENGYTMKLNNNGYLGWLSGNTLVAAETVESSNYEWNISVSEGMTIIANAADANRKLKYNSVAPRFATYNNSTTDYAQLYRYYGPEIVDPTYAITIAEGITNGTIAIEGDLTEADQGTTITVVATPDEGYKLESAYYTYNETIVDIDTTVMTFVMPAYDVEVGATFKLIPSTEYSITIADGIVNGTVVASAETALEETPITIEATPDEGYVLETLTYVYGNEEPIDITDEMGFIMPAADVTINATFAELPEAYFEPVTENLEDWTGEYIMAYRMGEEQLYALNSIVKIGSNYVGDTLNVIEHLNNGLIEANGATTAIRIAIEPSENGYTLNLNNNGYLGWLAGNTMVAAETVESSNYEWTLSYVNDTMKILNVADNTRMIKFNTSAPRFATYTLTSSVQTSVTLYKYYGPEIVDETYTLTVTDDIENGTIELSTYEATAGTTITVTATPDNGFVLEGLTFTYDETTADIDLATMSFTMPAANTVVSATFVEEAAVPAITDEMLPIYIQGKDGTNNNRLPYAYRVTISHLTPNATYRYANQVVSDDDNANYDGVGNAIYVDCDGDFVRTTSCNLTDEGNYGEFTTDENGEYTGWFITEATGNNRFTPGNHVYMRIRINDGNDGTTAAYKLTTSDYATVINFGTENEATMGTAIVGKTQENDKNFVFLFAGENQRPIYGTTIEETGVDYSAVSQYASFYQNQVSGNSGFWGGIIPNVNENGIRFVGMYDNCTGEATTILESEEGGVWDGISTANPTGGTSDVIFIDFTTLGVNETENGISIWNHTNEIVVDMSGNDSYRMTVYNILGQPVMIRDINGAGSHSVTHKLAAGLYIINLSNSENSISTKIVVR